jgi:phosphate/sulfate permease
MVFALLIAAIIWNLGTWYLGVVGCGGARIAE